MGEHYQGAVVQRGLGSAYVADEIDLMALVAGIWDGRWLIAVVTAICVCLGGFFLWLSSPVYSGTVEIRPIPARDALGYGLLNKERFSEVTSGSLLSSLLADLRERESLLAAMREVNAVAKGGAAEEYEARLLRFVYQDINIVPPVEPSADNQTIKAVKPYWTIEVQTQAPEAVRKGLELALGTSSVQVKKDLLMRLRAEIALHEKTQKYQIEDLDRAATRALSEHEEMTQNRIEFLREQSAIARALGVAKNTLEVQTFEGASSVVASLTGEVPFYLRGYEAIEKERLLLEGRAVKEPFIPELVEINNKRRALVDDQRVTRAELGLAESPLLKDSFRAASYNVNAIDFKSSQKPALILVLAAILGGMLGVFIVLLRQGLKSYKARQQALSNPV